MAVLVCFQADAEFNLAYAGKPVLLASHPLEDITDVDYQLGDVAEDNVLVSDSLSFHGLGVRRTPKRKTMWRNSLDALMHGARFLYPIRVSQEIQS